MGGVQQRADTSADRTAKGSLFAKALVPSVMLLPAGRGRAEEKAKQDIFRSVRGAAPILLPALGRGSGPSPSAFIPPASAALP